MCVGLGRMELTIRYVLFCMHELSLADELEECGEDRLGDQVLREIEEESDIGAGWGVVFAAELGKTCGILGKEILEDELGVLGIVELLELLPGRVF